MAQVVRAVDGKGRVTLPAGFANCTVLVEAPDANTVVLRRAAVVPVGPGDDLAAVLARPPEPGNRVVVSGADAARVAAALADPPPPNAALRRLMGGKRARKKKPPGSPR